MLDNFREWLSDNLRYILLGLAVLLVLVIGVCIFRLVGGSSSKKQGGKTVKNTVETEEVTEVNSTPVTSVPELATTDLVRDDSAILELVTRYYTAAASKDTAALSAIVDPWNAEVEASILSNDVIESYENIATYSKAGPTEDSYVVYAYYEGKIAGISTAVPSLSMLYVIRNSAGNLVVSDRNASQEVSDYINSVSSDADVQELIADVNRMCESAKNSDPALKAFMEGLSGAEPSTEAAESSSAAGGTATAISGVNVRSEPSTNGAILAVLYEGQVVNVVGLENDWVHVNFTDSSAGSTVDGYVAGNYLSMDSSGTV